jgi:ankyrin repeat protein
MKTRCRRCILGVIIALSTVWSVGCAAPTKTRLFHAIRSGNVKEVKSILTLSPWLVKEREPRHGDTPLIEAVRNCRPQIVGVILAHGGDVHERNNTGLTPLMVAALSGCDKVIPLLIKKGAIPNEHDRTEGLTPLHLAGGCPACIPILLSSGADPLARTNSGELPVHFAASAQEPASLKLLLQAGSSPNARDALGRTPLMNAVMPVVWRNTAKACVSLLLRHGADARLSDRFGKTVLHYVASFPLARLRQEGGGAVFDLREQERWRVEVAGVLIMAGADPSRKDTAGNTAADIARSQGALQLANLLKEESIKKRRVLHKPRR